MLIPTLTNKFGLIRANIRLEGIVQGVGFRPFAHRLSKKFKLTGETFNTPYGVEIEVEGQKKNLEKFYYSLQKNYPPLAKIIKASIKFLPKKGYKDFLIKDSKKESLQSALISPDIAICNDCRKELLNPKDKRFLYPFINCTNCGPRFSIIKDLPYDRRFTTMKKFRLCHFCKNEFENFKNKRYHAQPNACSNCGPKVELLNNQGKKLSRDTYAVNKAIGLLSQGKIIAIKGLGGFHIAANTKNIRTLNKLRKLKNRPDKPFAIMAKNLKEAAKICEVSHLEKTLLLSPECPIVLLKKRANTKALELLAPRNNYLGVMLPFTPLHHLLLNSEMAKEKKIDCLIMTSGNIANEPLENDNQEAIKNLKNICDYFLVHDRDIYNRIDDSIVQVIGHKPVIMRRARGYCPMPFILGKKVNNTLALGAELKNTFCVTRNNFAFLSQYIGDLKTYNTFSFYKEAISRFIQLFSIKPEILACDLHPDYLSTGYARALKTKMKTVKLLAVQHHQAHIASVIAEHRIKEKVIGICFDGIGFGLDGQIWGGEFFSGNLKNLSRKAHLEYVSLPGGDKATQEPFRMAISYLYNIFGEEIYKLKIDFVNRRLSDIKIIVNLIKNTSPLLTSSVGRLFDSVSSLLGICDIITYEAQAAIELQMLAEKSKTKEKYFFKIVKQNEIFIIRAESVFRGIIADLKKRVPSAIIARKFHNSIVEVTLNLCKILRQESQINTVAFSGGVFQNKLLAEGLVSALKQARFKIYYNQLLPPNDGSISLGQAVLANQIRSNTRR